MKSVLKLFYVLGFCAIVSTVVYESGFAPDASAVPQTTPIADASAQ